MSSIDDLRAALADRYELSTELGRGAAAVVFLARDLRHERNVAIKVLRPEFATAVGRERFLREIRIEAGFSHPNILPLHDSGVASDYLYYVMPYVAGSLRERLRRTGVMAIPEAVQLTLELLDALSYAHAQGVVHRDIKPENILVADGHAVVADFGIARLLDRGAAGSVTSTGLAIGTPAYIAPEQATGAAVDGRADIYAAGCVLYEMLSGEPPFTGPTAQAVIARHLTDPPRRISVIRPSVPPELESTVLRALAKQPVDRFETAARFAEALRGQALPAPEGRVPAQAGRRLVTVALVAVALLAGWMLVRPSGSPPPDRNRIAVFPLQESGGATGAGEDAAAYLGLVLQGTEPLKVLEGIDWIDPRREGAEGPAGAEKRRLSRDHGASWYLDGSILREPERVTVLVRLHDVPGDSVVARAGRSGRPDTSLAGLAAQAATDLLPSLIESGVKVDVGALRTRSPATIANFLQGERAYRRMDFEQALDHYDRAIAIDSTFVLAALKAATAAEWVVRLDQAQAHVALALAHPAFLTRREQAFATGLDAYLRGRADSAVGAFRAAVVLDPEWTEAWMALGETYYHLLPAAAPLDSLARWAFEQSILLDSLFAPGLNHLAELAIRRNDVASASRYAARFARVSRDSSLVRELDLALRCLGKAPDLDAWARLAASDSFLPLNVARLLSRTPAGRGCAEAGFRAVAANGQQELANRVAALRGLQGLLLSQGRGAEAMAALQGELGKGLGGEFLLLAQAPTVPEYRDAARPVAARLGTGYDTLPARYLWMLGVWEADAGDAERARMIAGELERRMRESQAAQDSQFAGIVQAHVAARSGDTVAALAAFHGLRPLGNEVVLQWSFWDALGAERLLAARLLMSGRPDSALIVASTLDSPQPISFVALGRESLVLRAAAADRLGDEARARSLRERLDALTVVGRSSTGLKP